MRTKAGKGLRLDDFASKTPNSRALYIRAKKVLPAGVTYGIRYFEPYPFFVAKARGSRLWDVDEMNTLISGLDTQRSSSGTAPKK